MIRAAASSSARCGERLREVAEMPGPFDLELLRVEAEWRGDPEQALHQAPGPIHLTDDGESRDQPVRADQEGSFLARQAVVGLVGSVAEHEPVLGQLLLDRIDCVAQALVAAGQETEQRGQQGRGVECVGVVVLAEHTALADAVGQDVLPDLVGRRAPLLGQGVVIADDGELGGAIQRHPAHQLRGHVVLRFAPRLPDALVRFAPGGDRPCRLRLDQRPQTPGQVPAPAGVQQYRVQHGAEHVVLTLVEGAVADPYRTCALVAAEVVARRLGQVSSPVDAVHDLQPAVGVRLEVGDELHELVGLPVQVQVVQRLQGERGVAHPRVAVVPVALTAGCLRQRRRQRGDGGPGRHVRQALDREGGAFDRVT